MRIRTLSDDEQLKLTTAADIWREGQRCPFIPYRILCCNPSGVCIYLTHKRFMRHLCEIHCLLMQEWSCITGSCNVSYNRRYECVARGREPPHLKGLAHVIDILKKSDHTQLMVNNDCQQTLSLNAAGYKPAVKHGQIQPLRPAKHKGEDASGQLSAKKNNEDPSSKRSSTTPALGTRLPHLFLSLHGRSCQARPLRLSPLRFPVVVTSFTARSLI